MTTTEFLKTRREAQIASGNIIPEPEELDRTDTEKAEELLSYYGHNPKQEDPRYVTSAGEYGRKAPSMATVVIERAAISQGFSSSFSGTKSQSSSMNTGLSRSNVHQSLDPQFA
jgi:hypothetical protein